MPQKPNMHRKSPNSAITLLEHSVYPQKSIQGESYETTSGTTKNKE